MKRHKSLIFTLLIWLISLLPSIGGLAVTDWALITTNVQNAKRDLIEQLLQADNQIQQIRHLLSRVKQAEDLLQRMGRPDQITDLPGFGREVNEFLKQIERSLPSFEIIREIHPDEVFQTNKNSPHETISKDIRINGRKIGEADGKTVLPELATKRTIAHYQDVRASVLKKRSQLKLELDRTVKRLQNASTTAEVDKLNAVVNALQIQMSANDADMEFAANEVMTRHFENLNQDRIRQKIQIQKDRADLKEGMKNHLNFFELPNRPPLFKTSK